jgi:hypothetical protein
MSAESFPPEEEMKKNMGAVDRTIRTIVALVLVACVVMHKISGVLAIVAAVVAAAFLTMSAVGWCPVYAPLKISTLKKKP